MKTVNVNKEGYLVTWKLGEGGPRTFACADRTALDALIYYLTGREASTLNVRGGLPALSGLTIAHPFHIWEKVGDRVE